MKLQQKIPLYVIAVMLLVGGLGAVALLSSQKSASTQMFEDTSSTLTDTILNSLEQDMLRGDRGHIQETLDNLRRHESVRSIDILSTDGTIWASSDQNAVGAPIDSSSSALMNSDHQHAIYGDASEDHMINVAAIPVNDGCLMCHGRTAAAPNERGNLGAIRVNISTTTLEASLSRSRELLILIGGFTFVLVAGTLVQVLGRTTLTPLARLTEASERISRGDQSARVLIKNRRDEIGSVSSAFNDMADTMQDNTLRLESANRELDQANRMKSQFLANMSHELRTPLNVIIGFSEVLRDTPADRLADADRAEFCENIVGSGHHLLELINDVLDLAKVEAGQMQLAPEEFHVGPALNEIASTMQPLAAKKGIELTANNSGRMATVFADPAKFRQIMYNLIGNAIKFTPDGGLVHINASVMGNMARFAVTDTGVGIAPGDQQRIFSEFQQVDGSASRPYEGTGLGLTLTRKFVEMQHGEIWVESEPGQGSSFYFTLPIPPESRLPAAPADRKVDVESGAQAGAGTVVVPGSVNISEVSPEGSGAKAVPEPGAPAVLVVEDDPRTAGLIGLWLTQEGYEVDFASDGVEALEKAGTLHPFAICLDIMLPRMDGWQVLHQLKSNPDTADLGVVICSALDNPELGFALGAADYCVKPLSRRHLLDRLRYLKEVTPGRRTQPQVLVAEADADAARHTASILINQGFGVITASDGQSAMDLALEQCPDIIIIDFGLPGVPSYEVITFLRAHPITADTPIIVTTERDISVNDVERLSVSQVQRIIGKGDSGKEQLLGEMFRLEKLHPEKAQLIDLETRLFNRRYFEKRLAEEVKRAQRYSLDLAVLLIELEHTDGNQAGRPERLAALAAVLRGNVRAADPLTRYGANRFGILLPETSQEAALKAAKKILHLVQENRSNDGRGNELGLCVKIAVSADHGGLRSPEDIMAGLEADLTAKHAKGGKA